MKPSRLRKDLARRKRVTQKGCWHDYTITDRLTRFKQAKQDASFPYVSLADLTADVWMAVERVAQVDYQRELLLAQLACAQQSGANLFSAGELVALVTVEVAERVQGELVLYPPQSPFDYNLLGTALEVQYANR